MPTDPNLPFSRFGTAPKSPEDARDHNLRSYLPRTLSLSQLPNFVGQANVEAHRIIGITNQMGEGACTGHAFRNVKTTLEIRKRESASAKKRVPQHGPRGIYNLGKQVGGYPEEEGAYLRDVLKAATAFGVPREVDWPYVAHTDDRGKPQDIGKAGPRFLTNAKRWKIGAYSQAYTLEQMLTWLETEGPLYMAMDVHENFFDSDPEGMIPAPTGKVIGGHSMCILAAQQSTKKFYIPNSWGTGFGKDGYCWIDFDHFLGVDHEAWAVHDETQ